MEAPRGSRTGAFHRATRVALLLALLTLPGTAYAVLAWLGWMDDRPAALPALDPALRVLVTGGLLFHLLLAAAAAAMGFRAWRLGHDPLLDPGSGRGGARAALIGVIGFAAAPFLVVLEIVPAFATPGSKPRPEAMELQLDERSGLEIVAFCRSPDPEVRRAAVEALLKRSDVDPVPVLAAALSDEDFHVRRVALWGLNSLDQSALPALPALVRAFRRPELRSLVTDTLLGIGNAAYPYLVTLLPQIPQEVRRETADDLRLAAQRETLDATTIQALARHAAGTDAQAAATAWYILEPILPADPEIRTALVRAIADDQPRLRWQAAARLAVQVPATPPAIGGVAFALRSSAVDLLTVLKSPFARDAEAITQAQRAFPMLVAALRARPEPTIGRLLDELHREPRPEPGQPGEEAADLTNGPMLDATQRGVLLLIDASTAPFVRHTGRLMEWLDEPTVRARAADALRRIGRRAWLAEPRLLACIATADEATGSSGGENGVELRFWCLRALAAVGRDGKAAQATLAPLLRHRDPWTRIAAAEAIVALKVPDPALGVQITQLLRSLAKTGGPAIRGYVELVRWRMEQGTGDY